MVKRATHRCTSLVRRDGAEHLVPCDGIRFSDGTYDGGCDESCGWLTGRRGYGRPPWPGGSYSPWTAYDRDR